MANEASDDKHLPYHVTDLVWSTEGCFAEIDPLEMQSRLQKHYPDGLTQDIVNFFVSHGRCHYCDAPIASDLRQCSCEAQFNNFEDPPHLTIRYPVELDSEFKKLFRRESSRTKRRVRLKLLEKNGGTHTQEDVRDLLKIQEGLCYFCGVRFRDDTKGNQFHVDHFEPLYLGGRNDVQNLVLTCSSCNLTKGTQDGDSFERKARRMRDPEIGRKLGLIRRRLNAYKKRRLT